MEAKATSDENLSLYFSIEENWLQKLVDVIIHERSPECIILFGSRARDDACVDSDVDLLVIEKEPFFSPAQPS